MKRLWIALMLLGCLAFSGVVNAGAGDTVVTEHTQCSQVMGRCTTTIIHYLIVVGPDGNLMAQIVLVVTYTTTYNKIP